MVSTLEPEMKFDIMVSKFPFTFNVYRYTESGVPTANCLCVYTVLQDVNETAAPVGFDIYSTLLTCAAEHGMKAGWYGQDNGQCPEVRVLCVLSRVSSRAISFWLFFMFSFFWLPVALTRNLFTQISFLNAEKCLERDNTTSYSC
jgi:hypothetical protein